jgi:hypothetical protein
MRFQQESLKNDLSEICDKIEPAEFIYFSFRFKGLLANKYFVVTDKKLIKYELYGQYWDTPWSEVVGIEESRFEIYGSWGYKNSLVVQTFNGPVTFDFGENNCSQFHRATRQALDDYTLQRKDIRALICSLKFEDARVPPNHTGAPLEGIVQCEYLLDGESCKALAMDKKGRIIGRESCLNDQKGYCCYQCSLREGCEISCNYLEEKRAR